MGFLINICIYGFDLVLKEEKNKNENNDNSCKNNFKANAETNDMDHFVECVTE